MKTNTKTTKNVTNVTSETKSTKPVETKSTKPVETKSTKPVEKPVEKPVATKTENTAKVNKLYSFNEVMKLFDEYNIGSKSKTNGYRIINGGSSLHVFSREFRLYATGIDFKTIDNAKLNDVKCVENDNKRDKSRPHTITITSNTSLVEVIKLLALNKLNAPC